MRFPVAASSSSHSSTKVASGKSVTTTTRTATSASATFLGARPRVFDGSNEPASRMRRPKRLTVARPTRKRSMWSAPEGLRQVGDELV